MHCSLGVDMSVGIRVHVRVCMCVLLSGMVGQPLGVCGEGECSQSMATMTKMLLCSSYTARSGRRWSLPGTTPPTTTTSGRCACYFFLTERLAVSNLTEGLAVDDVLHVCMRLDAVQYLAGVCTYVCADVDAHHLAAPRRGLVHQLPIRRCAGNAPKRCWPERLLHVQLRPGGLPRCDETTAAAAAAAAPMFARAFPR